MVQQRRRTSTKRIERALMMLKNTRKNLTKAQEKLSKAQEDLAKATAKTQQKTF